MTKVATFALQALCVHSYSTKDQVDQPFLFISVASLTYLEFSLVFLKRSNDL